MGGVWSHTLMQHGRATAKSVFFLDVENGMILYNIFKKSQTSVLITRQPATLSRLRVQRDMSSNSIWGSEVMFTLF
ncbi:hypothetical protein GCM10028868_12090 [Virgibacillus kimchii]